MSPNSFWETNTVQFEILHTWTRAILKYAPHVLALIYAAGPMRQQQCAKAHYTSIMLEISMTALFTPTAHWGFAWFCVYFPCFNSSAETKEQHEVNSRTKLNHHHGLTCCHEDGLSWTLFWLFKNAFNWKSFFDAVTCVLWWDETKCIYFFTVFKYVFHVSVLNLSWFIFGYFTISTRLYFYNVLCYM